MIVILSILLTLTIVYNVTLPEIPESLSATAYLPGRKKWYFSLYGLCMSALLLVPWVYATAPEWQFLPFITCACLMFASVTPHFKQEFEKKIHYTCAYIAFAAWTVWMLITCPLLLLPAIAVFGICMWWFGTKPYTYYAELISLVFLIGYLIWINIAV